MDALDTIIKDIRYEIKSKLDTVPIFLILYPASPEKKRTDCLCGKKYRVTDSGTRYTEDRERYLLWQMIGEHHRVRESAAHHFIAAVTN